MSRAGRPAGASLSPFSGFRAVAYAEIMSAGLFPVCCFSLLFTGEAGIDTAYDGLGKGDDDLAGVCYIQHALPVVRQQLLNAGIRLAKIIDENFSGNA